MDQLDCTDGLATDIRDVGVPGLGDAGIAGPLHRRPVPRCTGRNRTRIEHTLIVGFAPGGCRAVSECLNGLPADFYQTLIGATEGVDHLDDGRPTRSTVSWIGEVDLPL